MLLKDPPSLAPGEPLAWTDAEVEELARCTPEDIETAVSFLREHATPEVLALWEAENGPREQ